MRPTLMFSKGAEENQWDEIGWSNNYVAEKCDA